MVVAGGRAGVFLILTISVVLVGAVPSHATGVGSGQEGGVTEVVAENPPVDAVATAPPSAANNSSVRHERPERLGERSDQAALQRWLESHLESQLSESAVTLKQGEYERAKSLLNDSTREQLSKYVEVAGETDAEDENTSVDTFNSTLNQQQEYISAVQEYRETYREYQEAKQAGNDIWARKLARDLNQLASQVERTGSNLTGSYTNLSTSTETNFSQVNQSVTNVTENVSAQQTTVRQTSFTNTSLTVTARTSPASFREPLHVAGRLVTANGTHLVNRTIELTLGNQTVRTRTTTNGTFTASLRPTVTPLGRNNATIRYVPQVTAAYLGTNRSVPVTVTQTRPTVTLTQTPTTGAFNETVTVYGRVHAANVTANDTPVQVAMGDTVLGTTRTAANGSFRFHTLLPATVPAGTQPLRVSLPLNKQALASTNTTTRLQVTSTPTELTLNQSPPAAENDTVTLSGTLATATGTGVANETIQIRVGEQLLTTTTTNTTGQYVMQLPTTTLAAHAPNNTSVVVTALYPGSGNLETTRAQTHVKIGTSHGGLADSVWLILGGLVVLGALGGVGIYQYRNGHDETEPMAATDTTAAESTTADTPQPPDSTPTVDQLLHDQAMTHLEAGRTDTAVQAAYAAVRRQASETLGWESHQATSQTYWEFYHACTEDDAMTDAQRTALKRLTECYEQAQFTSTAVAVDRANEAITAATNFFEVFDSAETDVAD